MQTDRSSRQTAVRVEAEVSTVAEMEAEEQESAPDLEDEMQALFSFSGCGATGEEGEVCSLTALSNCRICALTYGLFPYNPYFRNRA